MEDVKRDTEDAKKAAEEKKGQLNGHGDISALREGDGEFELALPRKVREEGLRITRECLEKVAEMTE